MKVKYILIGVIALLLIGIAILALFGHSWAEAKLRKKIESIAYLELDSLSMNISERELWMGGFRYADSTTVITIQSVDIQQIKLYEFLLTGKLVVGAVTIERPVIELITGRPEQKDKGGKHKGKSKLPQVKLKHVTISDGHLGVKDFDGDSSRVKVDFDVNIAGLDFADLQRPEELIGAIDSLNLANLELNTKDGLYTIACHSVNMAGPDKLRLDAVEMKSKYSKYELARHVGHQHDWMDIVLDSICVSYASLAGLVNEKVVRKVEFYHPQMHVFLDKRYPIPADKQPKLLKELLAMESVSFGVDSVRIVDADIVYEEHVEMADRAGQVTFNDLSCDITNLYTYDRDHDLSPRLTGSCRIMDAGQIYADVTFPQSVDGKTVVKGEMTEMDLTKLNRMLSDVAFVEVESGEVSKADFSLSYDRNNAVGELNMVYEDLKVLLINKRKKKIGFLEQLESTLANSILLHKNNRRDHSFRVGEIAFERDPQKSMLNFWWKSIFTGILSSTGVRKKARKVDAIPDQP